MVEDRTYRDEINEAKKEFEKIVEEIVDKNETEEMTKEAARQKLIEVEHVEFTKDNRLKFTD